jgi:putative ABC transport system permease protein
MTQTWLLFRRLVARPLWREPVRTSLTILAVALGVGVVIAIDLAGQSAAGSFHSSLESLTGKSDLEILQTGGLDERILAKLVQLPYAFRFTPRIEDFASINGKGEAFPFLGLDLIGSYNGHELENDELEDESNPETAAADLLTGDPIWIGKDVGLRRGQHVRLLINDQLHEFTVAGILKQRAGDVGENKVIVADIGLAQKVTGKTGRLDSIDVVLPLGRSVEAWRTVLARQLPATASIEARGARTDENRKMLAAFRWNLRVLSYIALLVGAFLIYNTISISVVRRRNEIGIVRALGGTRGLILGAFLAEALFFAAFGSLVGVGLGRAMAVGAVKLVGSTVESLYVSSQAAPIALTWGAMLNGVGIGFAVSLLASLAPALEAARVPPAETMARGREEFVARVRSRRTFFWAIGAMLTAAALSQLPPVRRQPIFAYLSVLLLVAGTSAAIPNLVLAFGGLTNRALEALLGVEALLAMRSLRASIGRTSVLTAALATAVAMTASVGIMVGSFRETVTVWMNNELKADFYLRPAGSSAADRYPTMSARIADRIERIPGVAGVDRFRAYPISYQGLPAILAGGETSAVASSDTTRFLSGENRSAILRRLPTGNYVVVSEPFANKHHVHVGSVLALPLAGDARRFEVLGIYYDYATERGYVVMDRHTLLRYLPDQALSNLAVYTRRSADWNAVRRGIDDAIAGRAVLLFTNSDLRRGAIEIFDRTFRITYALEAVAIFVAVMGIAGALLALVIDRRREFALLRFLGAAKGQVRRIILCEAGLLGLLANGIGLALGTVLSLILIFVINKQSFGWTIQFHWPVMLLLAALSGIYAATVLAGLYPARAALRLNPIEVIHEE